MVAHPCKIIFNLLNDFTPFSNYSRQTQIEELHSVVHIQSLSFVSRVRWPVWAQVWSGLSGSASAALSPAALALSGCRPAATSTQPPSSRQRLATQRGRTAAVNAECYRWLFISPLNQLFALQPAHGAAQVLFSVLHVVRRLQLPHSHPRRADRQLSHRYAELWHLLVPPHFNVKRFFTLNFETFVFLPRPNERRGGDAWNSLPVIRKTAFFSARTHEEEGLLRDSSETGCKYRLKFPTKTNTKSGINFSTTINDGK